MNLIICPGCKQNASADDAACPKCGFDLTGGPDAAKNRLIAALTLSVVVAAIVMGAMSNRRFGANPTIIYDVALVVVALIVTAIVRFICVFVMRAELNRWGVALIVGVAASSFCHYRVLQSVQAYQAMPEIYARMYPDRPVPTYALSLLGMSRSPGAASSSSPAGPAMVAPMPVVPEPVSMSPQFAPLVRAGGELFASLAKEAAAMNKEFNNDAGLRLASAPEQLAQVKKTPATRSRLQRLLVRIDQLDGDRRRAIGQFQAAKVQSANVPPPVKATFLAALKPAAGAPIKAWTEFVVLQRKVVQQTDAVLAFTQSCGERFTLKQGQLAFTKRGEQAKYEQLQRDLLETVNRRDEHLAHMTEVADQAVQAIEAKLDASRNPTTAPALASTGS